MTLTIPPKFRPGVHSKAVVHEDVDLGENVTVEPYAVLGNADGRRLRIGANSVVRSHTVIEAGDWGPGLQTGHYTLIRDGYSGPDFRIGSYSSLEGPAEIGDHVRVHGRCEATTVTFRHFSRVYGGCYLTDNRLPPSALNAPPVIDEGAVLCMGVIVIAGVTVGLGAFVGAATTVSRDVAPATALMRNGKTMPVTSLVSGAIRHPWTRHYRDGYPPESWARIDALNGRILAAA